MVFPLFLHDMNKLLHIVRLLAIFHTVFCFDWRGMMLGIFLDTETNGLNCQVHRILEIALKIVDLSNGKELNRYDSIVFQPQEIFEKSDPESLKINGFSYSMLLKGKKQEKIANELHSLYQAYDLQEGKALYICQNPSFDRAFFSHLIPPDEQNRLHWPYHWLDLASMVWGILIKDQTTPFPWEIGSSKDAIANYFHLPPEEKPHRALNGVNHLLLCYEKIIGFPKNTV